MSGSFLERLIRLSRRPPSYIIDRVRRGLARRAERFLGPARAAAFNDRKFLRATGFASMDEAVNQILKQPSPAYAGKLDAEAYERICPGHINEILTKAEAAISRRVSLLGSSVAELGDNINWSADFKTGYSWPKGYGERMNYLLLENPCDVKVPWELSRQQWLIPLGQAYLINQDERYAAECRKIINHWIDKNPYSMSINWAIAMEASIRAVTWTWLFHAFGSSNSWREGNFTAKLLKSIWMHGDFIERHLEKSYINGNHYLSNAAGLAMIGVFLGQGEAPSRWRNTGFRILEEEMEVQVYRDGVDYEASVPYHRLVLELFLYPALYGMRAGRPIPQSFKSRILQMAGFIRAYSRPDGLCPNLGDADDARLLPFGGQRMNDHRYLAGIAGAALDDESLIGGFTGPLDEVFWMLGPEHAVKFENGKASAHASAAFADAGVYIMNSADSQVFIDAGPVGLGGYGGHGHNDCLSIEAFLDGAPLFADCGSYVYTASYEWHNHFRSTAFHNTPQVDGEEINRFIDPKMLWRLVYDAKPCEIKWNPGPQIDRFSGSHAGYLRFPDPVSVQRTVSLDKKGKRLAVIDKFGANEEHDYSIPFHFAPGVTVEWSAEGVFKAESAGRKFVITWGFAGWSAEIGDSWYSPSYGVKEPVKKLVFKRRGASETLLLAVAPWGENPEKLLEWAGEQANAG